MTHGPPVRRLSDWSGSRLASIAEAHDTPTYVIDLDRVRENTNRLQAAFPGTEIHYAVKANAGIGVLETLAAEGIGAECASAYEYERALDAGFDPGDILYTPVNPPDRDLDTVLQGTEQPLAITVGAIDTIRRLAERDYTGELSLRIHPGTGAGHSDAVSTGADRKFGIAIDRLPMALDLAATNEMPVVGVHAHAGSGILDEDLDAHRTVIETVVQVARDIDRDLDFIDIGGGFGVPYRAEVDPLDLDRLATTFTDAVAEFDGTVRIEPGRYLVADAGLLLTRVNTVKPAGSGTLAGVDAGMTDLLRPALYDSYHPLRAINVPERAEATVSVVGPICESTDVLARDRTLPAPKRGDLLAIGMTGAYGIEMASQYNSRPRPPVVAIDGETARAIRRREQLGDITRTERDR